MIYVPDLSKRNLNELEINRSLSRMIGTEMSYITKPCYYPKLIKYKEDLNRLANITDDDINRFRKSLSPTYAKFSILNDKYTIFLILCILYFLQHKKYLLAELFLNILSIKFYSSVLHISLPKFCNDVVWNRTLESVSPKHLFKSKNGVSNAVSHLTMEIHNKYKDKLSVMDINENTLFRMVYELRHRLAQSMKSFAEAYYKIYETSKSSSTSDDAAEIENIELVASKISIDICTFGQIDKNALSESIMKSGIKRDIGYLLVSEFSQVEHREKVDFIIRLMSRMAKNKQGYCSETSRNMLIRRIVNGEGFGNYKIKDVMLELVDELESAYRYTGINKAQMVVFISHYLSLFIKYKIC